MRRPCLAAILLAAPAAWSQAPQPPIPNSPLAWEVRDGMHPKLGAIKVAVPSNSVATVVGKEKILSLVFFSCEKASGRIAIELANAAESDKRGGLYPKQMPRLFCNPRSTAPRAELKSTWFVSEIGDAMARGFAPSDLRRCASLEITQEIALPRGWGAESQRVDIELIPYKKELEDVIATCADASSVTAQAPAPPPAAAPSPAVAPAAAPKLPAPAQAAHPPAVEPAWRTVRTTSAGRTNVRASPRIDARVVTMLDPGDVILAQSTGGDWWKVKPRSGTAYSGFVRRDRLVFP